MAGFSEGHVEKTCMQILKSIVLLCPTRAALSPLTIVRN